MSAGMGTAFGIVGRSGSGKTTLIEALLPLLAARGLRVNVIKHSHHDLEFEPPGKDSARFRRAGAAEVLVSSPYRMAILQELRAQAEPTLEEQLARMAPADLTLVEGFKQYAIPRIEVFRAALGKAPLYQEMDALLAVASDAALDCGLPCLALDRPAEVAAFILRRLGLDKAARPCPALAA